MSNEKVRFLVNLHHHHCFRKMRFQIISVLLLLCSLGSNTNICVKR